MITIYASNGDSCRTFRVCATPPTVVVYAPNLKVILRTLKSDNIGHVMYTQMLYLHTCMCMYVRCVYLAIKLNEGEMPIQNRTCVEWERQKYQAILYSKRTGFKYAALATMAAMLQT